MKDIFANLYNKVVSFFHQTDEKSQSNAKDVACNRLKLVLMQDRTNLTPAIMDRMRKELIELLSKYMELDRELLDLNFEHEDEQMALMLSIPVIRAKNEDEINEILAKEDEEKEELKKLREGAGVNEESDEESDEDNDADENEDDNESDDTSDSDDEEDDEDDEETPEDVKKEKFFSKKKGNKGKKNTEETPETPEQEDNQETENEENPEQEEKEEEQQQEDNNE